MDPIRVSAVGQLDFHASFVVYFVRVAGLLSRLNQCLHSRVHIWLGRMLDSNLYLMLTVTVVEANFDLWDFVSLCLLPLYLQAYMLF